MTLVLSCYGSGVLVYSSVLVGSWLLSPLDMQGLLVCLLVPLTLCVLLILVLR